MEIPEKYKAPSAESAKPSVDMQTKTEQREVDSLILYNAKIRFLRRIQDALKHEK